MKLMKMKPVTMILLILLAVFSSQSVFADTEEPETFIQGEYTFEVLSDTEVEVAKYHYPRYPNAIVVERIEIPAEVTYNGYQYKVKSIGMGALGTDVESITLGAKVIIIPEGVETIRSYAFAGCAHLEEISIPASVSKIEDGIFYDCSTITKLVVAGGNSVYKTIENELLSKDEKTLYHAFIKDQYGTYTVRDGIETLAPYAFSGNTNVTKVVLDDSVETIQKYAFRDLGYFNTGGPTIEEVKLYIPTTVKTIEEGAFQGAWLNVTLPDTMKSIPRGWFAGAVIENIVITDSVGVIEERAFYGCSIRNIVLSKNITTIEKQAFGNIDRFKKINLKLSGTDGKLKYSNGVLYSKSGKTIVKAIEPTANYKMPSTVRIIRPYAFEETAVKSIVIPKGVKILPEGIFAKCKSLTKLDLPTTITNIGKDAWKGSQLKTLTIRANKVPKISGKQQKVTTIDVKNSRIPAYKKALKGKVAYSKIK